MTLSARRVPRGAVGTLPGAWPVHGFPLADSELRRVPRDLRQRHRHRHLQREHGQAVPGLQPDRQQPGAQVRGHRPRPGDGQAAGRAARRHRRRGQRGGRGRALRRLAAAAQRRRSGAAPRPTASASGGGGRAERSASRWSSRTTTAPPTWCACCSRPRASPSLRAASAEAALRAGAAAAAQPDHARHPAARHRRLGVPRRACARHARWPQVPVVIIAGDVDSNMALTGGAAAVLQKPISRAQLKASLAEPRPARRPASAPTRCWSSTTTPRRSR